MTESVEIEAFQSRLWAMFRHLPNSPLTLPQIDRIRWHLFPEIRINQGSLFDGRTEACAKQIREALPDMMRVMDLQQEQLARSLGSGHRIIHGAAGAGKTLILVYRCLALAGALSRPILVLCYNKTLAARLDRMMAERGLSGQVHVRNFHRWCREQCRLYNVPLPPQGEHFFDALVQRVIDATERGIIPSAQYGAVMIDEGHDFEPEWMKLAVQMVDPKTESLLLLYDDAQSIYGKQKQRFSFSSVGIQARGRTTILRVNYRNTEQILRLATDFARELLDPREAEEDGIPLIKPESAGRNGPAPILVRLPNLSREVEFIGKRLLTHHEEDAKSWADMAVICRAKFIAEIVQRELARLGIPSFLQADVARSAPVADQVSILTMHSSKGLEFPVVAIAGLGYLPMASHETADEARLLYVAMTRSLDHLILTGHRDSDFMLKLEQAMA
ncbi:MAG: DEAD/DEAH box helicase [Wenzhouxiangella sp.]